MRAERVSTNDVPYDSAWQAGAVPAPVMPGTRAASLLGRERRSRTSNALRTLRNLALGFALIASVPLGLIARSDGGGGVLRVAELQARLDDAERFRTLEVEPDATITPIEAGRSLAAVRAPARDDPAGSRTLAVSRPWTTQKLTSDMFALRAPGGAAYAAPNWIFYKLRELRPDERAYLAAIGTAPVWTPFDRVARANAVDVIGGLYGETFRLPTTVATVMHMRAADTKDLAYAGVMRAAYLLSIGDRTGAERALRSVVSYGFALIDNATTAMDAAIGRAVINIGRDGLEHFWMATAGPDGAPTAPPLHGSDAPARNTMAPGGGSSYTRTSADLAADVEDASLARAIRFTRLEEYAWSSCASVRQVLLGPGAAARPVYDRARASLARYPSERAYIDVIATAPARRALFDDAAGMVTELGDRLVLGAAAVTGTVLQNPRIENCTLRALVTR